ncbi:G protein b-subunit, partial [Reticulomyxa filosa]
MQMLLYQELPHQEQLKIATKEVNALKEKIAQLLEKTDYLQSMVKARTEPKIKTPRFTVYHVYPGHFGKINDINEQGVFPLQEHTFCFFLKKNKNKKTSIATDGYCLVFHVLWENKECAIELSNQWTMTCDYQRGQGSCIATAGLDNIVSIYNVEKAIYGTNRDCYVQIKAKELSCGHSGYISSVKWSDEDHICSSHGDGSIRMWDVKKERTERVLRGHDGDVLCIDLCYGNGNGNGNGNDNGNGNVLASGGVDGNCLIWDTRMKQSCTHRFGRTKTDINSIRWLPNNSCLVGASDDGLIRLFDLRSRRVLNQYSIDKKILNPSSSPPRSSLVQLDNAPRASLSRPKSHSHSKLQLQSQVRPHSDTTITTITTTTEPLVSVE